jgi:hypothetical protein
MTIQLKKLFEMADRAAEIERNKETVYVVVDEYSVIGVFTDRARAHKIADNRDAVVVESYIDREGLK